jgi:hypothetical protein
MQRTASVRRCQADSADLLLFLAFSLVDNDYQYFTTSPQSIPFQIHKTRSEGIFPDLRADRWQSSC